MKQRIINHLDCIKKDLYSLSNALYNGESNEEWFQRIQLMLEKQGFEVIQDNIDEQPYFKAKINGGRGPMIGFFILEPSSKDEVENWKSCISSPISLGASLGLASILNETGGGIRLFSYPHDQGALILEDQELKEMDAGILIKAGERTRESSHSIYVNHFRITFRSKDNPLPTNKSNALLGVIQCFNGVSALQQSLPHSVKLGGIITKGGSTPEHCPAESECIFYVSSSQGELYQSAIRSLENCAKGAALQTDTQVTIQEIKGSLGGFITNRTLNRLFCHNLKESGIIEIDGPEKNIISMEEGRISEQIPVIYPCIGLQNSTPKEDIRYRESGQLSPEAMDAILKGSQAAAFTALDIITNKALHKEMIKEFKGEKSGKGMVHLI